MRLGLGVLLSIAEFVWLTDDQAEQPQDIRLDHPHILIGPGGVRVQLGGERGDRRQRICRAVTLRQASSYGVGDLLRLHCPTSLMLPICRFPLEDASIAPTTVGGGEDHLGLGRHLLAKPIGDN